MSSAFEVGTLGQSRDLRCVTELVLRPTGLDAIP